MSHFFIIYSEDRERYIRAKYIEKEFIADLSTSNLSLAMVCHNTNILGSCFMK